MWLRGISGFVLPVPQPRAGLGSPGRCLCLGRAPARCWEAEPGSLLAPGAEDPAWLRVKAAELLPRSDGVSVEQSENGADTR